MFAQDRERNQHCLAAVVAMLGTPALSDCAPTESRQELERLRRRGFYQSLCQHFAT
jgi:hypothetical protein